MNNHVARSLTFLTHVPGLQILARALLHIQLMCWSRKPDLTDRVSNFLLMGGLTSGLQVCLFIILKKSGIETLTASLLAVELSILISFIANANVTWKDRLEGNKLRFFEMLLLLLFFNLFHPALYIIGVGIDRVESALHVPFMVAWFICQVTAILVGFMISDELLFGSLLRLFRKST